MQDLRAAAAVPALQEAVGSASMNTLFILTGVSLVERAAVCGNQVGWLLWGLGHMCHGRVDRDDWQAVQCTCR